MAIHVSGIDHIYVAVADMTRSEPFYDGVMQLLGFRKGTKAIAGEPHAHYFNQTTQYTIRPARVGETAEPYRVGALHHLCFRVDNQATVDEAWAGLRALGVDASEPTFYPQYRADYYATSFADPDGVRLEIVCDTKLRAIIRERWAELDVFVDPISKLDDPSA